MKVRCVVTGQTKAGKSVIVRDAEVEPVTLNALPGYEFYRIWGNDSVTKLPTDGAPPPHPKYFPPCGGYRFCFFTLPPETRQSTGLLNMVSAFFELRAKLPGMAEVMEPTHPGMHTTDTVDFDVILSGEAWLELDDGAEVLMKAGDCVIQNGTRHGWHNRSSENCVIAVTLVGAERGR